MYDPNKIKEFAESLNDFYSYKEGEEKTGIGHGTEHMSGVISRSLVLSKIVNDNKTAYGLTEDVDLGITTLVAALHDIGNVINRSGHNFLGAAIIRGEFSYDAYFELPMATKKNEVFLNEQDKEYVKSVLKSGYYDHIVGSKVYNIFLEALTAEIGFKLAYYENNIKTEDELNKYIDENYPGIESDLKADIVSKLTNNQHMLDACYNEKLAALTKSLHEALDSNKDLIEMIAQAVEDHNIDFREKDARYKSRSIYGSIVSDADKDNVPETFILRTLAFSIMRFGFKDGVFLEENPSEKQIKVWGKLFPGTTGKVPDIKRCLEHVTHQAWERFRLSPIKYENIYNTKLTIPKKIFEYKKPNDIKGLDYSVKYDCPSTQKEIMELVGERQYVILNDNFKNKLPTLIVYTISPGDGVDTYMELVAKCDDKKHAETILAWKKDFMEAMQMLADPQKIQENVKKLWPIFEEWFVSKSNVEIIDKYEEAASKKDFKDFFGYDLEKYGYKEVIDAIFDSIIPAIEAQKGDRNLDEILEDAKKPSGKGGDAGGNVGGDIGDGASAKGEGEEI